MATLKATWRKITDIQGPQPRPRHGHRAAVIKDLIIVFGGGNEGMVEGLYVYNTSKNQWFVPATKGDIPASRAAFGLVAHDTRLLMFGGMLEYGQNCNTLYELQISRWEWKRINVEAPKPGSVPSPRFGHSFTALGEKVYLFGGLWAEVAKKRTKPRYLNDLHTLNIKDIGAPFWEAHNIYGPAPCPRESHTAVGYTENSTGKSLLIVYGGMNGIRLGDIWFLNCNTMTWMQPHISGSPPLPRSLHSSTVIGHRMFVFGGWVPLEADDSRVTHYAKEWKCTNTLACLNLRTLSWETVPTLDRNVPRARAGHCAVTAMQTRLYIWSGRDGYSKRWNNQICCKDFWFLETEVPGIPSGFHLNRATAESFQISWEKLPTAEKYIVQVQKYTKALREPLLISDDSSVSVTKQKNVNCNTSPCITNIGQLSAIIPPFVSNAAAQQMPAIQVPTNKREPAVAQLKSVLQPIATAPAPNNFVAPAVNATKAMSDQECLASKIPVSQPSTSKDQFPAASLVTDISEPHSPGVTVVKTVGSLQKVAASPATNTAAVKSLCESDLNTSPANSTAPSTSPNGNKLTAYIVSKGGLHVPSTVTTYQNNTPGSTLQIISDNKQVPVGICGTSTTNSPSSKKSIFTTQPAIISSAGISSNTSSFKPLPLVGANSAFPRLDASSSKVPTPTTTSNAPRKIITILQPRKQTAQQNVELPNQAIAIKRQEGTATPIRTVLRVSGSTNTLPVYRTGAVSTKTVSSAESNLTQLQIQKTGNTIMTPLRIVKTTEGAKFMVLQTKSGSNGVSEQGANQLTASSSKVLKFEKLKLTSATTSTVTGTTRAIVLKQINIPASSRSVSDGKSVNVACQESSLTDTVQTTLSS